MADPVATSMPTDDAYSSVYWSRALERVNEIGNTALAAHNRHSENVAALTEMVLSDARHASSEINQKFGILFTEPNAESAGAENTMKAGNVAELTAAAVQNVIGTANANIASAMADLKTVMYGAISDIKSAQAAEFRALTTAIVNATLSAANQVPTRPSNQAVENPPVVVVNPVKA